MATYVDGVTTLPGQEPVWNMAPGRAAALKLQSVQTGESVIVFEEVAPAGTETPLHLHHNSDEVMYILSGDFTFKIGEQVTSGGAGTCAFMPRGIAHAWKNSGAEAGRALFVFTPVEAGKVFEEFSREQRPVAEMNEPEVAEIFRRHGWEILGPSPF
jgi:quercetin dioxygenase-like cupin family protein